MILKPSELGSFISTFPKDIQILALEVFADERSRRRNGLFTNDEIKNNKFVHSLAKAAAKKRETLVLDCFK